MIHDSHGPRDSHLMQLVTLPVLSLLTVFWSSAGHGIKLAVACAPVRRTHRNQEYSARDYEVGWSWQIIDVTVLYSRHCVACFRCAWWRKEDHMWNNATPCHHGGLGLIRSLKKLYLTTSDISWECLVWSYYIGYICGCSSVRLYGGESRYGLDFLSGFCSPHFKIYYYETYTFHGSDYSYPQLKL